MAAALRYEKVIGRFRSFPQAMLYIGAVVVGAGGGLLGYYLTYEDKADYGNPNFVRVLEDKSIWRSYAQYLKVCKYVLPALQSAKQLRGETPSEDDRTESHRCEKYLEWANVK